MTVKQEFTGDSSNLRAEYQKIQRENAKLLEQNQKLASETARAHEAGKASLSGQSTAAGQLQQALGGVVTQVTSVVAAYASWQTAIGLVTKAFERQAQVRKEALDASRGLASSQTSALINVAGTTAENQAFLTRAKEINTQTGFGNSGRIMEAAGALVSATGDKKLALNVVKEMAPILRHRPDELETSSGAVGDMASLIGDQEGRKAIGLVVKTQQQARITSIDSFKNLAKGIAVSSTYDTGEDRTRAAVEAASVVAALTRATKDPEGRHSSTGTIALAEHLERFLPEKDVVNDMGEVVRKGTGLKTIRERIERVQGDVQLQRGFFEGQHELVRKGRHTHIKTTFEPATFEKKEMGVVRDLLTNRESQVARETRENFTAITPDLAAVTRLQEQAGSINAQQVLATGQVALEGVGKDQDTKNVSGAKAHLAYLADLAANKAMHKGGGLLNTMDWQMEDWRSGLAFSTGGKSPDQLLNQEIAKLKNTAGNPEFYGAQKATAQESRDELNRIVQLLEQVRDGTKEASQDTIRVLKGVGAQAEVGRHSEN